MTAPKIDSAALQTRNATKYRTACMRVIHVSREFCDLGVAGDRSHARVGEAAARCRRSAFGSSALSESTNAITSALVALMPAAIAARLPRFSGNSITRTIAAAVGHRVGSRRSVSSVEPSLTTTISSFSAG